MMDVVAREANRPHQGCPVYPIAPAIVKRLAFGCPVLASTLIQRYCPIQRLKESDKSRCGLFALRSPFQARQCLVVAVKYGCEGLNALCRFHRASLQSRLDAAVLARVIGYSARLIEQEYTVRAARPAEAPAVLDLWQEARSTHATTPDRIEYVHRLLAETPGSLLVADGGGALLGTLIAAWDGWRGNMYRLVVLREHRRRGIGLALVRVVRSICAGRALTASRSWSRTRTRSRRRSGSPRVTRGTAR